MENIIYAKSVAKTSLEELNEINVIHSIFENGINIRSQKGLIFIGTDKNGELPFGIHLKKSDMNKLSNIAIGDIVRFNSRKKILIFKDKTIDFNKAYYYSSELPQGKNIIKKESLKVLFKEIIQMDFDTGLDMSVSEILLEDNNLINNFKKAMLSQDEEYISETLRKIIGRGKGLTPSGDDLLIGLIWVNDIIGFLNEQFIEILKDLLQGENLTTDVSINYYKWALKGKYSSSLIELCNSLIKMDNKGIKRNILEIIEYGHTSGRDTLSGIALGVHMIIKY